MIGLRCAGIHGNPQLDDVIRGTQSLSAACVLYTEVSHPRLVVASTSSPFTSMVAMIRSALVTASQLTWQPASRIRQGKHQSPSTPTPLPPPPPAGAHGNDQERYGSISVWDRPLGEGKTEAPVPLVTTGNQELISFILNGSSQSELAGLPQQTNVPKWSL